jgi:Glutaredoxin-like domain (DUF836)
VTLYHAPGCGLCQGAREVLLRVQADTPFELEEVDIGGDAALEETYREWLPVVEVEGVRAFVYYVDENAFRRKLLR